MKLNIKKIIIFTLLLTLLPKCYAWTSSDNKVWLTYGLSGKLNDAISVSYSENLRYTEDDFEYVYRHSDFKLSWKINKEWSLAPTFRYTEKYKNGTTTSIPGVYIDINNSYVYKQANLKTRIRPFYGDTKQGDDIIDIRPKFTLQPKDAWSVAKLKPYVSDEMMFDLNDGRLYKNRLAIGLNSTVYEKIYLGIFIMQEVSEDSTTHDWSEIYNTGLNAAIKF